MSKETVGYQQAHSCATLVAGLKMAEHGHKTSSEDVDELIRVLCLKVARAQLSHHMCENDQFCIYVLYGLGLFGNLRNLEKESVLLNNSWQC